MHKEPGNLDIGGLRRSGFDRVQILHKDLGQRTFGFFPHASLVRGFLSELAFVKSFRVHHSGQRDEVLDPVITCSCENTDGPSHAMTGVSYAVTIRIREGKHGFQVIHFLGNGAIGKLAPGISIPRE